VDATSVVGGTFIARARSLVDVAKSDPGRGLEVADGLTQEAARTDDGTEAASLRAAALWVEGAARYELGQNDEAVEAMEAGVAEAERAGLDPLGTRIEISLAAAESAGGRGADAEGRLRRIIARTGADSLDRSLALSQLGLLELHAGNITSSLDLLQRALPVLEREPSEMASLARVVGNAGYCLLLLGRIAEARDSFQEAAGLAEQTEQLLVSAGCEQNLAYAQMCLGHLPAALESYDRALTVYRRLGTTGRNLATLYDDMAEAYRFAGLTRDALRHARLSLWIARQGSNREKQADAEYRRARCLLDHGHHQAALESARLAAEAFALSGRAVWQRRAQLLAVEAATHLPDAGDVDIGNLGVAATNAARELEAAGWTADACAVRNLASQILLEQGDAEAARSVLAGFSSPPVHRTVGMESLVGRLEQLYGHALTALVDGERPDVHLAAVRRLLAEHRAGLVDPELQAGVARLTSRFRQLALDQALSRGSAEQLLVGEEQWRATRVRPPIIARPHSDRESELLAELRMLCRDRAADVDLDEQREQRIAELETEIRRLSFTHQPVDQAAGGTDDGPELSVEWMGRQLESRTLVEFLIHRQQLHAVAIGPDLKGGVVQWTVGPWSEILRKATTITTQLERLMRSAPGAASTAIRWAAIGDDARSLGRQLFPSRFGIRRQADAGYHTADAGSETDVGGGTVVVAPLGLTALPWRIVLGPGAGPVALVPNAAAVSARALLVGTAQSAAVVVGPGLPKAEFELEAFRRLFPSIRVVESATAGELAATLEQDEVVHVAAHCRFRSESLLFSSLEMADGPVPVYELARLDHSPTLVVLSACNGGGLPTDGHGEWLGLAPELLRLGTECLVAPSHSVADDDAAAVTSRLYHHLASTDIGTALARSQDDVAQADPRLQAASHSFTVFGSDRIRLR
jgi:tetratricopeptide (TPR) repeat protein